MGNDLQSLRKRVDSWKLNGDGARVSAPLGELRTALSVLDILTAERAATMAIDENHPSVRRLVEKVAAERTDEAVSKALAHLLDGIGDMPAWGSLIIPDESDALAVARFEGWQAGQIQAHQSLLRTLRQRIVERGSRS